MPGRIRRSGLSLLVLAALAVSEIARPSIADTSPTQARPAEENPEGTGRKGVKAREAEPGGADPAVEKPAEPVVAGIAIREMRELSSDDKPDPRMPSFSESSRMSLRVTGGGVAEATRVTDVRIEEVVDDKGNDLMPVSMFPRIEDLIREARKDDGALAPPADAKARELPREQPITYLSAPPEGRDGIMVSFILHQAPRDASSVKRLRGSFVLMTGGKSERLVVRKPVSAMGKKLDDPLLERAGVRLTLTKGDRSLPIGDVLRFEAEGNVEALARVRVFGKDGEEIGQAVPDFEKSGKVGRDECFLSQPLDDECRVEITVARDLEPVKVNLDLKDIPLP